MIKNNRGIALASLIVTIIVMLTITGTIVYTSTDTIKLRKLDDMYNDIRLLNQKVANYHIENNELPVFSNAIHKNVITISEDKLNPNDGPYYYVIDLEKLNGISLKYGKKFRNNNILNEEDEDAYIINEVTHTIYYVKGIKLEVDDINIEQYTLEEEFNTLGYGYITIPEGFYYVGGNIKTGFVISDNEADENKGASSTTLVGNQFVWVPVNNDLKRYNWINWNNINKPDEISSNYVEDIPEDLENSIKLYGGFYIGRYEAGNVNNQTVSKDITPIRVNDFLDAQTRAESMYKNDSTKKVTSTLCYGSQWDAVLTYLSDVIIEGESYITYEGQRTLDIAKNIYNIHRGLFEWTMEKEIYNDAEYQVIRGSASSDNPDIESATARDNNAYPTGYRVALYINNNK